MNKIKKIINIIKMLKKALDVKTIDEVEKKMKEFYTNMGVLGDSNE